jgi:hypothetical protein
MLFVFTVTVMNNLWHIKFWECLFNLVQNPLCFYFLPQKVNNKKN